MKHFILPSFVAVSLLSKVACADVATVSRTVLLPDGKPAAGVSVLVRTSGQGDAKLDEKRVVTGRDGTFRVSVETQPMDADTEFARRMAQGSPSAHLGYILVDAPGLPLFLSRFLPQDLSRQGRPVIEDLSNPTIIKLAETGYDVGGKIQPTEGKLLPNIPVKVKWSYASRYLRGDSVFRREINYAEFTTIADQEGVFKFRPIAIERGITTKPVVPCSVTAETTIDSVPWRGETLLRTQEDGVTPVSATADGGGTDLKIVLAPTVTARGRVIEAATGKPMAGVVVGWHRISQSAMNYLSGPEKWVVTDKDGFWTFSGNANSYQQSLTIEQRGFVKGSIPLDWPRLLQTNTLQELQSYDTGVLRLRPEVPLKGTIIDKDTGRPLAGIYPGGSNTLSVGTPVDQPQKLPIGDIKIAVAPPTMGGSLSTNIDDGGTFHLTTGSGPNTIILNSRLYRRVPDDMALSVNVPSKGLQNLEIKVQKRPAYYLVLTSDDLSLFSRIRVRVRPLGDLESRPHNYAQSGVRGDSRCVFAIWEAGRWGQKTEFQVSLLNEEPLIWRQYDSPEKPRLKGIAQPREEPPSQEIIPWTTITADPKNWPLVIQVKAPLKAATP